VIAKPDDAAAFAAVLSGRYRPAPSEQVAEFICGTNTAAVNFGS
jgi:threonine dehydratase